MTVDLTSQRLHWIGRGTSCFHTATPMTPGSGASLIWSEAYPTLSGKNGLRAPAAGERLGGQALDTDLREKFYNQTPETRDQKRRWQLSGGPHQARKPWPLAMGCKTLMVPGLWQATNYQEAVRSVPRQFGLVACAPLRECVG